MQRKYGLNNKKELLYWGLLVEGKEPHQPTRKQGPQPTIDNDSPPPKKKIKLWKMTKKNTYFNEYENINIVKYLNCAFYIVIDYN